MDWYSQFFEHIIVCHILFFMKKWEETAAVWQFLPR